MDPRYTGTEVYDGTLLGEFLRRIHQPMDKFIDRPRFAHVDHSVPAIAKSRCNFRRADTFQLLKLTLRGHTEIEWQSSTCHQHSVKDAVCLRLHKVFIFRLGLNNGS